jgi:hypothetical protein
MTPALQNCGTCKWFDCGGNWWGWCTYPVPAIPFPVPAYLCIDQEAGWRDLGSSDGTDCPTYEVKP